MRSLLALAIVLAAASPIMANETPEAVYLRFHRAALEGDVKTMRRHVTEAQLSRMKIDSDAEALRLQALLPTSYAITGRAAGSTRVVFSLQGSGEAGASSGKVTLVKEGAEWKVDRLEWAPTGGSVPQFTARPGDGGAGAAPAAVPGGASTPGSISGPATMSAPTGAGAAAPPVSGAPSAPSPSGSSSGSPSTPPTVDLRPFGGKPLGPPVKIPPPR